MARDEGGESALGGVAVRAPAKINLALDVLGKRPDGYHDLRGVMQALALHDRLVLSRLPEGAEPRLECVPAAGRGRRSGVRGVPACGATVPEGERNLALRALRALERRLGRRLPARMRLEKRIPVAAGLGGGSSDAAAVLRGLVRLFGLDVPPRVLAEVAAELGADVPFFLVGGTCRAEGKGEVLTPLPFPGPWRVVLARPPLAVSTAEVYLALDLARLPGRLDTEGLARALADRDFDGVCHRLGNALESVTLARHPEVAALKARFRELGAPGCLMSGSGPTVFALARDDDEAGRLAAGVAGLADTVLVTQLSPLGACVEGEDAGCA